MKPKSYIETSVVSYLTAQPSRDIVTAAQQQITREWWQMKRRRPMPQQDEIITEMRAIREAYAERFGFDIRALWQDAKELEGEGGRQVIALEPRRTPLTAEREDVQAYEPA
jgi:hypothetical protein